MKTQDKSLKPIVVVGSGEFHFRLLLKLSQGPQLTERPLVFISEEKRHWPRRFLPSVLLEKISWLDVELDFWSLCQKAGIHYLEDECVNISREESTLYLKKYGRLEYHAVSLETRCVPRLEASNVDAPYLFKFQSSRQMQKLIREFIQEVDKHCPRETRVMIQGLTQESLDWAMMLGHLLKRSSQSVEVIILIGSTCSEKELKKYSETVQRMHDLNIRLVAGSILEIKEHQLRLDNEQIFDFDVFIPLSAWQSRDWFGKIYQNQQKQLVVKTDLSLLDNSQVFIYGDNVFLEEGTQALTQFQSQELLNALIQNLNSENIQTRQSARFELNEWHDRPYLQMGFSERLGIKTIDRSLLFEKWRLAIKQELQDFQIKGDFQKTKDSILEELTYHAQHMSRPWQGSLGSPSQIGDYRMITSSGFNQWGSVTQSTQKLFEMAVMKAFCLGVEPQRLRFMLTLPRSPSKLFHNVFESTLKAIEEMATEANIELDGGDAFDGEYWRLSLTLTGPWREAYGQKFKTHDYLLITRPLGYGLVWTQRTHAQFSSRWFDESLTPAPLLSFERFAEFMDHHKPSAVRMVEEWGFIHHALQGIASEQQLMVNFREIPRAKGVDVVVNSMSAFPALDQNWERIKKDVAFERKEVSALNSILWDPLSQGALVIGVNAKVYEAAQEELKNIGFRQTKLMGCVRPKVNGNKLVLSDWVPHESTGS